ncbi:hypothetical protein FQA39_LY11661 [Lamprigera yunnana]|nr:hypothetical protein FQA39_LY11661 [Lamprigera yunnana]
MKVHLIILVWILTKSTSQAQNEKSEKALKVCSEKTNLNFTNNDEYARAVNEGRERIPLFSECYLRELGYLDKNGSILYEEVKRSPFVSIPSEDFSSFVDYCRNATGKNVIETSHMFSKCLLTKITSFLQQQKPHYKSQKNVILFCSKKTSVNVTNKENFVERLLSNEASMKLFSECYLRELGYLSNNGTILYNEVKKSPPFGIPIEQYSKVVDNCKTEIENNSVAESYKFTKCLLTNVTKLLQQKPNYSRVVHALRVCSNRTNLKITNRNDFLKELTAGTIQVKLFCECYLRELGVINSNESILYNVVKNVRPPEINYQKYSSIVDNCKNEKGKNITQISYTFLNCLLSNVNNTIHQEQEESQKIIKVMMACSSKTNLNIKTQADFISRLESDDQPIRSFSKCYLRELGYLDHNGSILYNKVKKNPSPHIAVDKYSQIVIECENEAGKNSSEVPYKFMKCLLNNVKRCVLEASLYLRKRNAMLVCSKEYNLNIKTRDPYIRALAAGGKTIELYSECYLKQLKYLDNNGTILYDKVKKAPYGGIPYKTFSAIVDHCKNEKGNSISETSSKFTKCLLNNVLKYHHQRAPRYLKKLHAITVCSGKTNLSLGNHDAYVKQLSVGGKQMQLFSECYLSELDCLDINGNILYKEVKKLPSPGLFLEQYSRVVDQCERSKGNGVAETSYEFLKCIEFEVKKFYQNEKMLE